ncbi:MAG TPA: prenyltransferase/squalene oxidase repeat-containing protein [Lacipirellula sp.]
MSQPDLPSAIDPAAPPPLPVAVPVPAARTASGAEPAASRVSRDAPAERAKHAPAPHPAPASTAPLPPQADHDYLEAAPAWLISAIVHMLLVIILGLWLVATEQVPEFVLSLSVADDGGEDFNTGELDMAIDLDEPILPPGDAMQPLEMNSPDTTSTAVATEVVPELGLETADAPPIQLALSGRGAGMKDSLLRAYGGTAATESAVTEALKWLARNQQSDSLWSLTGKYADGANSENHDAATAMALLAFQGAGYTPMSDHNDPFTRVVTRGWNAFRKRQKKDGSFFQEGSADGRMYTNALATIALCELYGMTKDTEYRDDAQRAIDYCIKTQSPEGGWRYQPGFDSDTSVTGWFVMALQSARMAGLEVDSPALGRINDFLDTVAQDGGAQYSYVPGQGKKLSMTAEGLLCRQYLGWSRSNPSLVRGVEVLTSNLPQYGDNRTHVYYWYYAAQVCHHMEGPAWRRWNGAMREVIPALQVRDGKERGSWDPTLDETTGVAGGGRLFVTCLATYCLEVYYRHLPLYQLEAMSGAVSH